MALADDNAAIQREFLRALSEFAAIGAQRLEGVAKGCQGAIAQLDADNADAADDDEFSYAPMLRLLTDDDERFFLAYGQPVLARRIHRAHRRVFARYLRLLATEIRSIRRVRSRDTTWTWEQFFGEALQVEGALLALRFLTWKFMIGLKVRRSDVSEKMAIILIATRFGEVDS